MHLFREVRLLGMRDTDFASLNNEQLTGIRLGHKSRLHRFARKPPDAAIFDAIVNVGGEKSPVARLQGDKENRMDEDIRLDAQYDPKNKQPATAKRIRFSFLMVVLLFTALGLAAVLIATKSL
jgi:hypothetical protein